MPVFTVTEQEQERDCGWRWDFNSMNRMSLEPVTPLKALWLGTLVHKSLDLLAATTAIKTPHSYLGPAYDITQDALSKLPPCEECGLAALSHVPPSSIYELFAEEKQKALIQTYKEKVGVAPTGPELKESLETIALGRAMFNNYLDYYKTPLPKELEYISTEQSLITEIPGTEHCACVYPHPEGGVKCRCTDSRPDAVVIPGLRISCRPYGMPVHYTHCGCKVRFPTCSCRQLHKLESTLDGLVRRIVDGAIFILENKTYTFHPKRVDLLRTHQFMGYTWSGNQHGLNIEGVLYNGLWKRPSVPEKSKWTKHDLFTREYLPFNSYILEEWGKQCCTRALRMGDPEYVTDRNVKAVGGCNGVNQCHYKALCDARYENTNFDFILKTRYQKREKTSIFAEEENEQG